ncbi:MAG: glycerol-3-phosphate responsive antiterminator [Lachnospiraceae bacterium]|nr:glycerol-3-phosphate responsive antiterminator [Lachnospiraceae bacterium]
MDQRFYDMVEANPVIAAVKNKEGLEACCKLEDIKVIFILYGSICNIGEIVKKIKEADKVAMVHIDLISGLAGKEIGVNFIRQNTQADGIITTKPPLIKRAKELEMYTILRVFLLDSMAYQNIQKEIAMVSPDIIEVLPGLMPKVIRRITDSVKIPVIAGGLISEKEDVVAALGAGAISVSTTNPSVWEM